MFKLNLKIAWRNLWKNKGYTLINILGLSIGMASCILIFIFIRYQMSFDKNFANADRIYRVVSSWDYRDGNHHDSQGVPKPLAPAMKQDLAAYLDKVSIIQSDHALIKSDNIVGKEKLKVSEEFFYVEPDFFLIFDHKWLSGTQAVLEQPNQVVLTKKIATKFFGDWQKSIGKTLHFDQDKIYKVSGVIDDVAENSSIPLKIMVSYKSFKHRDLQNWGSVSSSTETYVLLKKGMNISSLDVPLQKFVKKYYKGDGPGKEGHSFQALDDIHYNDKYGSFSGLTMPLKQLYGLMVIGLFLILTACINFINLATAQAVSRSKEVGVRKVMGSKRKELVIQFLTETFTIVVMALLIACVLTEFALPWLQNLFQVKISFSIFQHPIILVFMIMLVLLVSALAGFYPAIVMSGFNPALAIKNKIAANTGGLSLRKVLVVVQFTITIVLIIGTVVVLQQMKYVRQQPLGFNPNAIAMVDLPNDSITVNRFETFKSQLSQIQGIENISLCRTAPSSYNNNESNFSFDGKAADFQANTKLGDEKYLDLFDLKLVAGRNVAKADTMREFLVNETFLKKLNIKNPNSILGKIIDFGGIKAPVVGVMADFKNESLRSYIAPIIFTTYKPRYYKAALKLDPENMVATMANVEKLWNSTFPEYIYGSGFLDQTIQNYYEGERVLGVLFRVFAATIMFISFIGLFGLISFVATQRTREVAIRKVLGASSFELVKMLNSSFLSMVFVANLIAWPLAYLFVSNWLSSFVYRIDVSIWPFAIAMSISMFITLITVSLRSYRAAVANTIDALKYE